jgi:hypothetical protein
MHAYGYSRRAKLTCKYRCCQERDAMKEAFARDRNDRARKKAARQDGKRGIFTDLIKNDDNRD